MLNDKIAFTFNIPASIYEWGKKEAEERGVSLNAFFLLLITDQKKLRENINLSFQRPHKD